MQRKPHRPTYIRAWREARGLSLRRLEARLESEPGGAPVITAQSISRIERGIQPYSQEVLEALADALDVTPADLIGRDPNADGEVVDLVRHLSPSDTAEVRRFIDYLRSRNAV